MESNIVFSDSPNTVGIVAFWDCFYSTLISNGYRIREMN